MKSRFKIIAIFLTLFFYGCAGDPNEKANKLYTEASQSLQISKTEKGSYSDMFNLYKNAKSQIEQILSKYPSSNIAVELSSGNVKISGLTLNQFRKREGSLKALAEAEQLPFSCALLVAKTIEDAFFKASALAVIADRSAKAGQFNQALEIAKTIEDASFKASALAVIADWSAEAGQFNQALEIAKTIERASYKARALADIAGKYAEAGQKDQVDLLLSQALQIAKTIEDASFKAIALADIAGKYAEAAVQPREEDKAILRDITHTIIPMSQF
jgi:tetratricopeptide (TPR) repeat protein